MKDSFLLLKVRTFGDIFSDTFSFIKKYGRQVGYVIMVLVVPLYIIGSFLYANGVAHLLNFKSANVINWEKLGLSTLIGIVILSVGRIVLSGIFISACLHLEQISDTLERKDIFNNIRQYIGRLLVVYLVLFLFIVVFLGIWLVLVAVIISIESWALVFLLSLGMLVLGIYLMVSLVFVPIIYVRENCGLGEAISRSFYLVRSEWWWTFLILVIAWLIGVLGALAFGIPYIVLAVFKAITALDTGHAAIDTSILDRLTLALNNFGSIITTMIVTLVSYLQYYSLVEKKDGLDIMQRIENIGIDETPVNGRDREHGADY